MMHPSYVFPYRAPKEILIHLPANYQRNKRRSSCMRRYLEQFPNRLRHLYLATSLATLVIFLLVSCGSTSTIPTQPTATLKPTSTQMPAPAAVADVKIVPKNGHYIFDPATLMVKVGTQVIWSNETNVPHTVTSDTGVFNTPPDYLLPHQVFKFLFTKPGTYTYYCNFHLYMKGTIVVIS
jgi:plastocyanin